MKKQIGPDIIKMYKPFENKKTEWKTTKIGNHNLYLPSNFQPVQLLGVGSYGVVVAAKDHNHDSELVAVKKMINVFDHKTFARRTLRQLRLLRLIKHQNVIQIKTIVLPPSREEFNDLCVVFELMGTDLTDILRSQEKLTKEHNKYFMYQILRALKYIHSSQVVHRDLKPRNILLDSNCDLKVCDFGLSRPLIKETVANGLTDYVTTRWYRAPQLLLGQNNYSPAVDMWSLGCMWGQILLKHPILTANSTKEQITLICEVLGMPDLQIMNVSEQSKTLIKKLCNKIKKPPTFQKMTQKIPAQQKQLLKRLLAFEPQKRITAIEALALPYFQDLHLEEDQPLGQPINTLQFQFQDHDLTTQQIKDLLYEQILIYNFPQFAKAYQAKKKNKKSLISHILASSNAKNIDPEADDDGDQ